jgi:hypothetical protein
LIPKDRGRGVPKAARDSKNKIARNSLKNKDFTSKPFKIKDLSGLASKSLIPKDRREGGEP